MSTVDSRAGADTARTEEAKAERRRSVFQESKAHGEKHFDPAVNLCVTGPENSLHMTRESLLYAMALFEGNTEEEHERGRKIVDAVLSTQVLVEGSPRYGCFKWNWEDGESDPPTSNTGKFICPQLAHLAIFHAPGLGEERVKRLRRAVEAAAQLSLHQGFNVDYANICLLACLSLIAIGEWLGKTDIEERGTRLLGHFISHMNLIGGPSEFNSPTYTFVDILALAWLRKLTRRPETRLRTKLLEDRVWLQLASHYHPPTGLVGGPYSRGYQNDMTGDCSLVGLPLYLELGIGGLWNPQKSFAYDMSHNNLWGVPASLVEFHLSPVVRALFRAKRFPYLTTETTDSVANRVERSIITTWQTARYSLGSNGRGYHYLDQAGNFMLHYLRPGEKPGIVYSKLRLGDQRYGSFEHSLIKSRRSNDDDRGTLYSVQSRNRFAGLYAVPRAFETESIAVDLVWPKRTSLEEVWAGERRATSLPFEFSLDQTVCIRDGEVMLGVKALPPVGGTQASRRPQGAGPEGMGGLLHTRDGYLYLSLYLYRGSARAFSRTEVAGGFVAEVEESAGDGGFAAFRRHCAGWALKNVARDGRVREAGFSCPHGSVELRYDVELERVMDRHADGEPVKVSTFDSPTIRQGHGGLVEVGHCRLQTGGDVSAILAADEESMQYSAVNPELWATPIALQTPQAEVRCGSLAFGRIDLSVMREEGDPALRVSVDALHQLEPLEVRTRLKRVIVVRNGKDASSLLVKRGGGVFVLPEGRLCDE